MAATHPLQTQPMDRLAGGETNRSSPASHESLPELGPISENSCPGGRGRSAFITFSRKILIIPDRLSGYFCAFLLVQSLLQERQ